MIYELNDPPSYTRSDRIDKKNKQYTFWQFST